MARKRAKAVRAGGASATEAPAKVTKADAVRAALAEGRDVPLEGVAFIKERFGIDLAPQHFSSIKSQQRRKARSGGGRGRTAGKPVGNGRSANGVELVREMASVFA